MAASPDALPGLILPAIAGLVVTVGLAYLVVRIARRSAVLVERERARRFEKTLRDFIGGSRDLRGRQQPAPG